MDQYVVRCDCSEPHRDIATIADERQNGGSVYLLPAGSFVMEFAEDRNRRGGDTTPLMLRCSGPCGRTIHAITSLTARDVIDRIADRSLLEIVDRRPQENLLPSWMNDVFEFTGGNRALVIPFNLMCYAVTKLGKSR